MSSGSAFGYHGFETKIKLLPQDIQVAHSYGNPFVQNDGGHIDPGYGVWQYWSVIIPRGMKATAVYVYTETLDADGVEVFEGQINTGTAVGKGAGLSTNSEESITNVTATDTNYLIIKVNVAGDDVYGGYVLVEPA